jgi:dienelactone hydrolase
MALVKVPYEIRGKQYAGRQFEGVIVYDESVAAQRPAIFMQPDWKGVCTDSIEQARAVAGQDYVVLIADMFGAGYGEKNLSQEVLRAGMLTVRNDLAFTLACGGAAYTALMRTADSLRLIDTMRRAAIGYCAGAGFALEQARAGADFQALVAFHTTNPNPLVADTQCSFKGRVLALHGADDPITPKPAMHALEDELTAAGVDWQLMMFGGAVHSFCDPTVNDAAVRYDAALCKKSYTLMRQFFSETF